MFRVLAYEKRAWIRPAALDVVRARAARRLNMMRIVGMAMRIRMVKEGMKNWQRSNEPLVMNDRDM